MSHECPVCHKDAVAVIPPRISQRISLQGMYRHRSYGQVYLHEITEGETPYD